jgi:hypothetical protein
MDEAERERITMISQLNEVVKRINGLDFQLRWSIE